MVDSPVEQQDAHEEKDEAIEENVDADESDIIAEESSVIDAGVDGEKAEDKMEDDEEEETYKSGLDIIGLNSSEAAEILPLEEKWWSAAPAIALEPLSPEQLIALVCDGDNVDGKDLEIDPNTPPVIRASINTLLTQPYDTEAWARLVDESKNNKWRRREILFAATRQFPTSGKCWVDYIRYELTRLKPDLVKVDKYWNEAMGLSGHSNLELWMLHLQRSLEKYDDSCADRDHAVAEHRQADIEVLDRARKARNEVVVNFEHCLTRVGFDYAAGELWIHYANFVRSWPQTGAGSTETQERTKLLRSIYQRASALPLRQVTELWKKYENFETHEVVNNETLGAKKLDEHRVYYKSASATARERASVWDSSEQLNKLASKFPSPPLSSHAFQSDKAANNVEQAALWTEDPMQVLPCRDMPHTLRARRTLEQDNQLLVWRRRCQYEAANKQKLSFQQARNRAVHTFEQCLAEMRFYPECWYQYAQFELNNEGEGDGQEGNSLSSRVRRAGAIYRRALVALPGCTLLYVAYAECMESIGELDSARAALVSLVKSSPSSGIAWALLQKFIRKSDGVQAARMLFRLTKKARESEELGSVMYLAHALLEWHANENPSVALRVFEYAAGRHPHFLASPEFALAYAECTMAASTGVSSVRDCRSIFERCITAMTATMKAHRDAKAKLVTYSERESDKEWRGVIEEPGPMPVWFAFMKFEVLHGSNVSDGKRLVELEKRMIGMVPSSDLDISFDMQKPIYPPSGSLTEKGGSRKATSKENEAQLQRLWWRHSPPGIDALSCATQSDASFYARCFRTSVTSKETPLVQGKQSSWLSRARTFSPLVAMPSAMSAASMLNSETNNEEQPWLLQHRLNQQVSPANREEPLSIATSSTASLSSASNISSIHILQKDGVSQPAEVFDLDQVVGDGKVDIPMFLKPLFVLLPPAATGQKPDVKYIISSLLESNSLAQVTPSNLPQAGLPKRDRFEDEDDVFRMRQRARIE